MNKSTCPECNKGTLIERRGEYETSYVDRNGQSHALRIANMVWLECDTCGEALLDDHAMSMIDDARRKALGLLTPQEIRAFRLRLQKTQAAMSEFLGIGEKTYCRWESGSYIQSEGFDRYLRLLIADEGNVQLLQDIADVKRAPQGTTSQAERIGIFPYITDLPSVEERGHVFVELLARGALYAVQ